MGVRRQGREAAIQCLFLRDFHPDLSTQEILTNFREIRMANDAIREFAERLVAGVLEHQSAIDTLLAKHLEHYALGRLSAVDRNILRLAIFEIQHCPDVPPAVAIDEAIEIAKHLSSQESGRFVNGVLDRIRADLNLPARTAA